MIYMKDFYIKYYLCNMCKMARSFLIWALFNIIGVTELLG
jgi:hypothetical protein